MSTLLVPTLTMRELRHWPSIAGMSQQSHVVMRRMGALDCLHDVTIYLYYALCFMLIEHFFCHEPISLLINVVISDPRHTECSNLTEAR